ncbi:4-hydroxy-tetrahydrodipicolinate reductase [Coraliomargarita akajimensis]|uniref:4-hydroxy-tetrahydrodipicolinate reductase n=1 Tax=Coraliomargarita akajimensis (strain DSM 45221 / IAM 15411 / JCM 23193 / KCTC 12865 / 04OKA010-24) TaxID=583355 RepID=D5EJ56_CORAD|nr:4-hydroxy-tetrahydrodipicolinate reductase [Coraliomargarita akajimensis]ADE54455.1 dihydrodipicolinate reductase [Coraliomargarita akajimensis DSM 45221]
MPLKILMNGSRGRMGLAIIDAAEANDAVISAACDAGDNAADHIQNCDAIIDFSFHEVTPGIATLAAENNLPLVIGTTGHTSEERKAILAAVEGKIPVVWAGNYSVGVNTLNYLTRKAATILGHSYDPEVMEMHHHHKKDAPSGTAERLIEILKESYDYTDEQVVHGREGLVGARPPKEIGVHALRGGDIVGEHTVYFCGDGERIELTHRATDRKIFAQGAIRAAHWAVGKAAGVYNMEDVLGLVD